MNDTRMTITGTPGGLFRFALADARLKRTTIASAAAMFHGLMETPSDDRRDAVRTVGDVDALALRCADAIVGYCQRSGLERLDFADAQDIESLSEALAEKILDHFTSACFSGALTAYGWDFIRGENGQYNRFLYDLHGMPGLAPYLMVVPGLSSSGLYAVTDSTTGYWMRRKSRPIDPDTDRVVAWADDHETAVFRLLEAYHLNGGLQFLPCYRDDPPIARLIEREGLRITPVLSVGKAEIEIAGDHPWTADGRKTATFDGFSVSTSALEQAIAARMQQAPSA